MNVRPSKVALHGRDVGERGDRRAPARWIALSASHGRAEWPLRPRNVQVALMFPRQPACSALAVGSMTTTRSASRRPGSRASSGVERALGRPAAPRGRRSTSPRSTVRAAGGAQRQLDHHRERALHVGGAEPVHARRRRGARGGCPAPGTVSRWPASRTSGRSPRAVVAGQHAGVAGVARAAARAARPARARPAPPRRATPTATSTSSSVRAARRSARSSAIATRHAMRRGDALLRRGHLRQARQPAARDAARAPGRGRRRARGDVLRARRRRRRRADRPAASAARRSSRSTRRRARAWTCSRRERRCATRSACPTAATSASRVCDALLFRRRLPLYPVPAADQALTRWEGWMERGFDLFAALDAPRAVPPDARRAATLEAPGRATARCASAGCCETYPDAVFCALLGHRPPAKRTPWGLQQRIAALRLRGVVDDDGGLWHRTLDELDACAAAYAAYALADGRGLLGGRPARGRDRPAGRRRWPSATRSCRRRGRAADCSALLHDHRRRLDQRAGLVAGLDAQVVGRLART